MTKEERQQQKAKAKKKIVGGLRFIVKNTEKILINGKKWIVVVLIPTLEIISSILSMMEDNHDDEI